MAYQNLAGIFPKLNDGNLRFTTTNDDPVVLVVGTASSGFTSTPYVVNDQNQAIREFGLSSELTRKMLEVASGGARNLVLWRLPGEAPVLRAAGFDRSGDADDVFTIRPVLASSEASTRYGIAYQHYTSTRNGMSTGVVAEFQGKLMVVDLETQQVVWRGSADGQVDVDLGLVEVEFPELPASNSVIGQRVQFTLAGDAASAGSVTIRLGAPSGLYGSVTVPFENEDELANIRAAVIAALNAHTTGEFNETFVAVPGSGAGVIEILPKVDGLDAGELWVYPEDHVFAGYPAELFWDNSGSTAFVTITGTGVTVAAPMSIPGSEDVKGRNIGLYPLNQNQPFSRRLGGQFIPLERVETTDVGTVFRNYATGTDVPWVGLSTAGGIFQADLANEFAPGDKGTSISLMKRYEKLEEAYDLLDFARFDLVVPCGVILDAPNIADNSDLEDDDLTDYPAAGSSADVLGRLLITELNDEPVYIWDTGSDGTGNISSHPEVDPTDYEDGDFKEVSFAHQLARFCYETSENYRVTLGFIGTSIPRSLTPRAIKQHFGRVPKYEFDFERQESFVADETDNGRGLLGHKLVGGNTNYNDGLKGGGLYATVSRAMESVYTTSNTLVDENGRLVDIGKYLLVSAAFGTVRNASAPTGAGYLANLAGVFAGRVASLPVNISLTNQQFRSVGVNYNLDDKLADEIAGARLLTLIVDDGTPTCPASPTFAISTSDYSSLTTMRIVASVVEDIRRTLKPFLGRALSASERASIDQAIGGVYEDNLRAGLITSMRSQVQQTRAEQVAGKLRVNLALGVPFELKQIFVNLNLEA